MPDLKSLVLWQRLVETVRLKAMLGGRLKLAGCRAPAKSRFPGPSSAEHQKRRWKKLTGQDKQGQETAHQLHHEKTRLHLGKIHWFSIKNGVARNKTKIKTHLGNPSYLSSQAQLHSSLFYLFMHLGVQKNAEIILSFAVISNGITRITQRQVVKSPVISPHVPGSLITVHESWI